MSRPTPTGMTPDATYMWLLKMGCETDDLDLHFAESSLLKIPILRTKMTSLTVCVSKDKIESKPDLFIPKKSDLEERRRKIDEMEANLLKRSFCKIDCYDSNILSIIMSDTKDDEDSSLSTGYLNPGKNDFTNSNSPAITDLDGPSYVVDINSITRDMIDIAPDTALHMVLVACPNAYNSNSIKMYNTHTIPKMAQAVDEPILCAGNLFEQYMHMKYVTKSGNDSIQKYCQKMGDTDKKELTEKLISHSQNDIQRITGINVISAGFKASIADKTFTPWLTNFLFCVQLERFKSAIELRNIMTPHE
jgi:hypothetical protein